MSINNKKYLDYAGLEKLKSLKAVVPHPTTIEKSEAAYKVAINADGHIVSSSPLTPADLGLDNALHFIGVSNTDPLSPTGASVPDHDGEFKPGDVCLYKRTLAAGDNGQGNHYDDDAAADKTTELYYEEYIYTGTAWELLGDASSYALKDITISGDGTYITGGGDLSEDFKLSHKTYTNVEPAIIAVGRDSGGHVKLGGEIVVQSGGGSQHGHSATVTVPAGTFLTNTGESTTKLSTSTTTAKVLSAIPGAFANLETTQVTGVTGSTTASKATASAAVTVAKAGTAVKYGTANAGTEVTGLAKRAANKTTVGNANVATEATVIGNADVGAAVRYGTANVGAAVTYGTANVGDAVTVATRAASQTTIGNANVASEQTLVGNADVGEAVVYGTADVGAQITVDAGKADVGSKVTVATRASSQTTVGNANVATAATFAGDADVGAAVSVLNSFSNTARSSGNSAETDLFHASVEADTETLVLTPRIISAGNTNITPAVKTATSIYGAVSSTTKIYAVGGTADITPAVASNRTVSFTPAAAADTSRKLTPAKAVSDQSAKIYGAVASNDKIYGVGGTTNITPAVASTTTLTPAVAAPSTQTLTPAAAATKTIYGAVESTTKIYGVTDDQVSIIPAVEAPATQTIIPAVANGTITPYTFADVTVPVADAKATTVATGEVSVGADGDEIMVGVGTLGYADVLDSATLVSGNTGITVVTDVTAYANSETTLNGSTDSHTCPAHTHQLAQA